MVVLLLAISAAAAAPAALAQQSTGAAQATELWGGPAAKGTGNSGSRYDTNITVTSLQSAVTGNVDFWAGGALKGTVPFSLSALGVVTIPTPTALDGAGAFLYRVSASAPVIAYSETYNDTPSGRFGVSTAAFTSSDLLSAGDEASGGGAEDFTESTKWRSNVGVLCSPNSATRCTVQVTAYRGGSFVGTGTLDAVPGAAAQSSLSAIVPGAAGISDVTVQLRVFQGMAQPYVIRNDNRTSDGTFVALGVNRGAFSTAPTINSFTATPGTGCAPLQVTLTWATTGAVKVNVSGVSGDLPPNGSTTATLTNTTDLVLTATAPTGDTATLTRHVSINQPAVEPAPFPADAQIITGGTVTGIIPPEPAGTVSASFVRQDSGNSTFTLNGSSWIYVAGTTPGTDIVRITATGACGPVTSDFTATVLAPGAPQILTFTAYPKVGCAPAQIVLSWTTADTQSVTIGGIVGVYAPNGSAQATISAATTFTLKAKGYNGLTSTKQLTVPVDTALPVPILAPTSTILFPGETQVVMLSNVPNVNTVNIDRLQNQSGGTFYATGFGAFLYTAGPIGGGAIDIFRIYDSNGCGVNYATFQAEVK